MPISHQHRCIFIHVPKCGGTSLEDALGMLRDWRTEDAEVLYGRVSSPAWLAMQWRSNFLQHLTWREFIQAVPEDRRRGYRSFAFVRHPLHRLASEWANLDGDLLDYARARGVELSGLQFEEFVVRAVRLDHPHLRPQLEFLQGDDGSLAVQEIGRFESLQQDFARICGAINVRAMLPHRNRGVRPRRADMFTARALALVAERYKCDFEAFGYQPGCI